METQRGTIIARLWNRGYGFIRAEDGKDIYFNEAACIMPADFRDLREGHEVEFVVTEDRKGRPRAIGVVVR